MRSKRLLSAFILSSSAWIVHAVGQTPAAQKVDMVTVTGCVTQGPGDTWLLTNATDPTVISRAPTKPSAGTGAPAAPAPKPTTVGKNRFQLIGILELNVPAHKGHTVTVKGLLIAAQPNRRINLTSVQMVTDTCASGSPSSGLSDAVHD